MTTGGNFGAQETWGHHVTPFRTIDRDTGAVETRTPLRTVMSGFSPADESPTVNKEKRFLKQNFSGIPFSRSGSGRSVEFIAVGGTELLGYQSKAVVSYTVDSLGAYVDCANNPDSNHSKCELFPDTPRALGECGAVRVWRIKSGDGMENVDWLVCIGGRYKIEIDVEVVMPDGTKKTVKKTVFKYHKHPWYLDLDDKDKGWRQDKERLPEIPTSRHNAAVSAVVTIKEPVINEATGEPTGQTKDIDRVFLIGGRRDDMLLASTEAFNLTTGEWERDWPGLNGLIPEIEGD